MTMPSMLPAVSAPPLRPLLLPANFLLLLMLLLLLLLRKTTVLE